MVMSIFALIKEGIIKSFADTESHSESYNSKSIPESAHKDHMGHIPHPFKTKRKHYLPPNKTGIFFKPPDSVPAPAEISADNGTIKILVLHHMQQAG